MSFFCNIVLCFLKNKMKQIKILFFVLFLAPGTSKALNLFEMFMIKTGVALVYYQYNDKSLDYENEFSKKKIKFYPIIIKIKFLKLIQEILIIFLSSNKC